MKNLVKVSKNYYLVGIALSNVQTTGPWAVTLVQPWLTDVLRKFHVNVRILHVALWEEIGVPRETRTISVQRNKELCPIQPLFSFFISYTS